MDEFVGVLAALTMVAFLMFTASKALEKAGVTYKCNKGVVYKRLGVDVYVSTDQKCLKEENE